MKNFKKYAFEYGLVFLTIVLTITGFWDIYFGAGASPTMYQNFHIVTIAAWLGLMWYQLNVVRKEQYELHRKTGVLILFIGPLLVAMVALLAVHSAYKGVVSGKGDALLVQNVMGVLELGLLLVLGFVVKKKRKLHGAFLLSTAVLFIGVALFFTFISFVPQYKIEGPETFYRFADAGIMSSYICLGIGLIFFIKDRRNNWPMLLAGLSFTINGLVNLFLINNKLIQPVTEFVGSLSQVYTFLISFVVLLGLLIASGIMPKRIAE